MTRRSRAAKVSSNTSAPFPRATVSDCPAGTGASVKIPCSSKFLRKKKEEAADWLERYESTAKYNGGGNGQRKGGKFRNAFRWSGTEVVSLLGRTRRLVGYASGSSVTWSSCCPGGTRVANEIPHGISIAALWSLLRC